MSISQVPTEVAAKGGIPPSVVLAFWLILLPLALVLLGIWQLDRSMNASRLVEANGLDMARTLEEIRPIAAKAPGSMIRFEGGQSFPASMAVAELENAVGENDLLQTVAKVRHPFAYLTIAGGVLRTHRFKRDRLVWRGSNRSAQPALGSGYRLAPMVAKAVISAYCGRSSQAQPRGKGIRRGLIAACGYLAFSAGSEDVRDNAASRADDPRL